MQFKLKVLVQVADEDDAMLAGRRAAVEAIGYPTEGLAWVVVSCLENVNPPRTAALIAHIVTTAIVDNNLMAGAFAPEGSTACPRSRGCWRRPRRSSPTTRPTTWSRMSCAGPGNGPRPTRRSDAARAAPYHGHRTDAPSAARPFFFGDHHDPRTRPAGQPGSRQDGAARRDDARGGGNQPPGAGFGDQVSAATNLADLAALRATRGDHMPHEAHAALTMFFRAVAATLARAPREET